MSKPLLLVGVVGSPYSRKMRGVLRYRRIPFQWVQQGSDVQAELPKSPLPLLPILYYPSETSDPAPAGYEATSDSTFMLRRLEGTFKGRSVVPSDPLMALLDFLIEDYADEWFTKRMFHYRWAIPENCRNAGRILPRWYPGASEEMVKGFPATFGQRQFERLRVVGSNEVTAPIIEASYQRLLAILELHFQQHRFVMGQRPGTGDFGLFGQLSQLVQVEPTSQVLSREIAPRVIPWCDNIEDLSGLRVAEDGSEGWTPRDELPETLRQLLGEIGRTYVPFLLGNAKALDTGAEQVDCAVDGARWTQTPFKYQGKCLGWLREAHAGLADADRVAIDAILAGTGCEALFP